MWLLSRESRLTFASVWDGLSARLAELANFDGVFVGGYELAATRLVPDANILPSSEHLAAVANVADSVASPILADCDNGFGDAMNVSYITRHYERAGASGITLEDTTFPKRALFYGRRSPLVETGEHVGKIRAAVAARRSDNFVIVARTEAITFGLSVDETLERATSFADAGADAIMVMTDPTNRDSINDVIAFAQRWERSPALMIAPTKFGHVTADELHDAGFNLVILSTVGLRAAIRAIQDAFKVLREERKLDAVEDKMISMEELHDLVGYKAFEALEREFIPA